MVELPVARREEDAWVVDVDQAWIDQYATMALPREGTKEGYIHHWGPDAWFEPDDHIRFVVDGNTYAEYIVLEDVEWRWIAGNRAARVMQAPIV